MRSLVLVVVMALVAFSAACGGDSSDGGVNAAVDDGATGDAVRLTLELARPGITAYFNGLRDLDGATKYLESGNVDKAVVGYRIAGKDFRQAAKDLYTLGDYEWLRSKRGVVRSLRRVAASMVTSSNILEDFSTGRITREEANRRAKKWVVAEDRAFAQLQRSQQRLTDELRAVGAKYGVSLPEWWADLAAKAP